MIDSNCCNSCSRLIHALNFVASVELIAQHNSFYISLQAFWKVPVYIVCLVFSGKWHQEIANVVSSRLSMAIQKHLAQQSVSSSPNSTKSVGFLDAAAHKIVAIPLLTYGLVHRKLPSIHCSSHIVDSL